MYAGEQDYESFSSADSSMLEKAYNNNESKLEWKDNSGNKHNVSFTKMVHKCNQRERGVKRISVFGKYISTFCSWKCYDNNVPLTIQCVLFIQFEVLVTLFVSVFNSWLFICM